MPDSAAAGPTVIEAVTCLVCGCLCDDLSVVREGGVLTRVEHACTLGREWLLRERADESARPPATIDGVPAEAEAAVSQAAGLLAGSRAPIVVGLGSCTQEGVAAALALADRIGAVVDPGEAASSHPRLLAFQRAGRVSATLGEVKNRADVVVFWGADPVVTHPRHFERYSVEPKGRFVPEGRAGRTIIVVDRGRTSTAEQADLFVPIDENRQFETLWTLRALVRGLPVDRETSRFLRESVPSLDELRALAQALGKAHYGAFFHGPLLHRGSLAGASANLEAAASLVRDLNRSARFVMLGLGAAGNQPGAESVLARQTGFPAYVDLSAGYPASMPGVTTAFDRLARGEADLAVIVGDLPVDRLDGPARAHLARIPRVVIAPAGVSHPGLPEPSVRLNASTPGLDEEGTVSRVDGVSLPLRPVLAPSRPSAGAWLGQIAARLASVAGA
jgi:formylmethanofuran dehydrogenase subunit B